MLIRSLQNKIDNNVAQLFDRILPNDIMVSKNNIIPMTNEKIILPW